METQNDKELYSVREAAEYLGMNFFTWRRWVLVTKEVKPDVAFKRHFLFKRETLDRLKQERQNYLSVTLAAEYLGIAVPQFDYYQYAAPEGRRIVADRSTAQGTSRRDNLFSRATLDEFKERVLAKEKVLPAERNAAVSPVKRASKRRGPRLGPRKTRAPKVAAT